MEYHKSNLQDASKDTSFLYRTKRITPVTEHEILLEKELVKRSRDIETLQRIHNSVSVELLETNKAISLLARKYERVSQDKEVEIAAQIENTILPSILTIKDAAKNNDSLELEIEILVFQVKGLIKSLTSGDDSVNQLTPAEMRVAVMIKHGITSNEIAKNLFISESTVKTHRKNIRNKLNLQNKKLNLASCLDKIL
ncbi:MAG: helix-turn-helix transcriptional regulator [Desulfamplus sp.]